MQVRRYGHYWTRRPGLCPAVVSSIEVTGKHWISPTKAWTCAFWDVEVEFKSLGRVRVGSTRRPWRPRPLGMVYLYRPGVRYWEDWDYIQEEDGSRHGAWISFEGGTEAGLGRLVQRRYGYAFFRDPTGRLGELLCQAARAGHRLGDEGFWRAQATLSDVVDLLLHSERVDEDSYRVPEAERTPRRSEFVRSVQAYMGDHLADKVTLHDVARSVHLSSSALSHQYKDETGETPMAALTRLRINQAKALLLRGEPLKAIAIELGFCDAFHLSRTFKRVEGIPPRDFVRNHPGSGR